MDIEKVAFISYILSPRNTRVYDDRVGEFTSKTIIVVGCVKGGFMATLNCPEGDPCYVRRSRCEGKEPTKRVMLLPHHPRRKA